MKILNWDKIQIKKQNEIKSIREKCKIFRICRFIFFVALLFSAPLYAPLYSQGNLGVDVDDSIYELLDSASMKGYINDLSQYRPYSANQIYRYLEQIRQNPGLSGAEQRVIDGELSRFLQISRPPQPDKTFMDFLADGAVLLSENENLPLALRLEFDFKNRIDFVSKNPYLFNVMRLYFEGDITPYFSYQAMAGTGLTLVKGGTFAPYAYIPDTDGHSISAGNIQTGNVSFSGDTLSLALQVGGKAAASFFDGKVRTGLGYMKRNIGFANTSLIYSAMASPLLGWDLSIRPFKWAALNFMVGGLNGVDATTFRLPRQCLQLSSLNFS